MKIYRLIILLSSFFLSLCIGQQNVPFDPNAEYDTSIPDFRDLFGFEIGDKPIRYHQVQEYFKLLSESSGKIQYFTYGATHEGRDLFYAVISSEENLAGINDIKENLLKLSDPRLISGSGSETIISETPAVALMMYSIHGDELSGTDAGTFLAYHLTADLSAGTSSILKDLVIIIYPMENPDGRERFLSKVEMWEGKVQNSDIQSLPHYGVWPNGRTNHYFFDLNRDWFINSQPETHARVKLVEEWKPQLVVDAHEMGAFSTYLFNPPREPVNPNMSEKIVEWWKIFAADQAAAFDSYGWSYYTREWLEEWYPGYGSSYPSYLGAVSILYEQASTDGSLVKKPEGVELTFSQSVHHQFVSSIANLKTAKNHREELLRDYLEIKKEAIANRNSGGIEAFLLDPSANRSRTDQLASNLLSQGIEIYTANDRFTLPDAADYFDTRRKEVSFPAGTYIIPMAQPKQPLIKAIMEFDTRLDNGFLKWERESQLKGEGTKLYEVTAWSMPVAYGADVFKSFSAVNVERTAVTGIPEPAWSFPGSLPGFGYIFEFSDASAPAIIKLLDKGYKLRGARKTFTLEGKSFGRGTILIRLNENPDGITAALEKLAAEYRLTIYGTNTALSRSGPDLGGGEFDLLYQPKTALLTGSFISTNGFGELWYLLDYELGLRITKMHANIFSRADLNKYNIIVLPSASTQGLTEFFDKDNLKKLKDWIAGGGTFIAVGNSAAFAADSSSGLSAVVLRRQSLTRLEDYNYEIEYEKSIGDILIDSLQIWDGKEPEKKKASAGRNNVDLKEIQRLDKEALKFMPDGVILRADLNNDHWLCYGLKESIPVFHSSGYSFLSKRPVETAARYSSKDKLRISGLLWPEAADRLENSACLTRERYGKGQIVLFSQQPNYRSYFYASARMLINAIIMGPGMGTSQTVDW